MKVGLVSDLHLEFSGTSVNANGVDVLVAAGDILPISRGNAVDWLKGQITDKPVIFVPGNHDYYGGIMENAERMWRESARGSNVSVLINDTVSINGVEFVGTPLFSDLTLYGDTLRAPERLREALGRSIPDFTAIKKANGQKWTVEDMIARAKESIRFVDESLPLSEEPGPAPVVITHWAPSQSSIDDKFLGDSFNPYFVTNLEHLVVRAQAWLHGHTHSPARYRLGDRSDRGLVVNNPRGYVSRHGDKEIDRVYKTETVLVEKQRK